MLVIQQSGSYANLIVVLNISIMYISCAVSELVTGTVNAMVLPIIDPLFPEYVMVSGVDTVTEVEPPLKKLQPLHVIVNDVAVILLSRTI